MIKKEKQLLNSISQTIFDKKGENILVLDVRQISSMSEFCIIAQGGVGRHVKSICDAIKETMRDEGTSLYHCDGETDGEWIVMDYGDIVIHLFVPDMREKYALEELWNKAKIVDVEIQTSQKQL